MRTNGIELEGLGARLMGWSSRIDALTERARRRPARDMALDQAIESLRHKRDAVEVQLQLLTQPSLLCRENALRALPLAWRDLATTWDSVVHHIERERTLREDSAARAEAVVPRVGF